MNDQTKDADNPKILCVEDDEDSCQALAEVLRYSAYNVTTATTVAEGLCLARERRFDLVILDNWFKESSGVALCRLIREFDREVPIVFYSAAAYETDVRAGLEAGAQAYVVKPDFEEFNRTITEILSLRKKK